MKYTGITVFAILAIWIVVIESQDPCTSYKTINEPHRSSMFIPGSTDSLLCDRALYPGWYRFQIGDMPTSCVQPYHCGTHAPIWLQGTLPAVGDGIVQRKACINYGVNSFGTACCNSQITVQVKNCGAFRVYHLVRTPGCAMAYCAGDKQVCAIGQFNFTTQSCVAIYPKLTQFPTLSNPVIDQNNKVIFPCQVNYPTGEKDVAFDISWTIDGQPLLDPRTQKPVKSTLTGDQRLANLDASFLTNNLGKTVHCTVRSYFSRSPNLKSDVLKSNGYWAGIRTSKAAVTVDEKGPDEELVLESTLPVPCNSVNKQECTLRVEMQASGDPNDVSTSSCYYELKYDPATKTYKAPIKIHATRDFVDDHDKAHELSFRPIVQLDQPMWMGYRPPPVQIKTKNHKHGTCNGHADPHFRGLDHKKNYNIYQVGDMLMYKSKSRPFEIQTRNWLCGKFNPCICSVIAREGNDIVQVDMCPKRRNQRAIPEMKVISRGLDGTTVDRDPSGKKFYINFPSGARVAVTAHVGTPHGTNEKDGYLNVDVQVPPDDIGDTTGVCGTFDFKIYNDFTASDGTVHDTRQKTPNSFAKSWVLKPGTSMFDQPPLYDNSLKREHHYCQCRNGVADCTKQKANNPSQKACSGKCITVASPSTHRRRDVDDPSYKSDDPDVHLTNGLHYREAGFTPINSTFPTPSGITLAKARTMCMSALMKSTLFHRCAHEQDIDINDFIDGCVEDVKYADSEMFMISHMNAFDSACQDAIMRNVSNYKTGPNGEMIPPLDVTTDYCPNQCNLQGTCVNGHCNCNAGFTAVDCSVPIGEAPAIDRIRGDGLCDIRTQDCSKASVVAENLMDVPHLKCKFRPITVGAIERPTGSYRLEHGIFKSFLEVDCPLSLNGDSLAQGYMISVTTDGYMYSAEKMYVVYDSLCQVCDNTGLCTLKNNSCLIDGHCRRNGEENHKHQICKPSVNQTTWSTEPLVDEIDHFTASFSGCLCPHDPSSFECACCQNGGCPCASTQQNQCVECSHMENCGMYPHIFPPTN